MTQYVGITETSDPAFNLELFDNLYEANIIITKRLTNKLIEKLLSYKDKCILHLTVTGMGGSQFEPFVPTLDVEFNKLKTLIEQGFPIEQVVLRIDPIIPNDYGIQCMINVIETFKTLGIKRVRFSIIDLYKHVIERFNEKSIDLPFNGFNAPKSDINRVYNILKEYSVLYNFRLENCAENIDVKTPCISQLDLEILNKTDIELIGSAQQRESCSCPSNKKQLIDDKPSVCQNQCLYCFWKK